MIDKLYLIWQDPLTRTWYPVGCVSVEDDEYAFVYTRGALESDRFILFGSMNNIEAKYVAKTLFPLFANRVLAKSRPEYSQYLSWMGFDRKNIEPLELLARSGGERATDSLQIYPCPEKTSDRKYKTHFFCHGVRHLRGDSAREVEKLKAGQPLLPMLDVLNAHDPKAISLRTSDPALMIGYCPRYLTRDVHELVQRSSQAFDLHVERLNDDAPIQYRVLCQLLADWPEGFEPCSDDQFRPIGSEEPSHGEIVVNC